ncbi:MAG: hypothetical protein MUF18_00235 [Fimbriiglobus sp.]|nr:hypothetical protein [Fimbriiglobus sp.]
MQSTEGKLNAVGVWLYAAAGGSYVAQTWTNDAGEYQFTGVGLGDYRVTFKAPAPAAFTLYRQGTNPQLDSDVVTATTSGYGNTPAVSVTAANLTLWDISAGFILGADPKPTTIKLSVAGLDDKDKGKAPGKKAHINDNFDEGQKTMQALVSDNLPDPGTGEHQIKAGDPDLVPATLNMTSGVTDWWMLDWTIGPNVKVWYKGWVGPNAGKWVEANDMEFGKIAVPATIDLMVEGMDVGAGTVKVELVVKKGNPGVADEAAFTVYTGLRLTGTKAADAVGQLENATGWTLNKNAAGDIWRTGGALNPEQWRKDAQAATKPIFENEKVTSIAAENKKEIQIGNWDLKALDPNDISVFYTADERWGAGAITHEIVEQYHGQVLGKNYNQAHAAAIVVESKIVAGGGTRTDTPKRIPGTNKIELTLEFQNGIIATLVLDLDRAVNPTNVNFRRP